jgi:hypothetical protein
MLRLKNPASPPPARGAAPSRPGVYGPSDPVSDPIYTDFKDPYLVLLRLLNEAAGLEQILMVNYLYAMFSIKDEYDYVRGNLSSTYYLDKDARTLLGVAVEEMQHLNKVNRFLVAIGGAPDLSTQDFPYYTDIYPFDLEPDPLTQRTAAKFTYIEADDYVLNPKAPHTPEQWAFIKLMDSLLGSVRPNHLGSLYHAIIKYTQRVAADPPDFLRPEAGAYVDWTQFEDNMLAIAGQGEIDHYAFFKGLVDGSAFRAPVSPWTYAPDDPRYPTILFDKDQCTALEGQEKEIRDPISRQLGWLSNLHYWIILSLLDADYRYHYTKFAYAAIGSMTEALYGLGYCLAGRGIGLPFDPPSAAPCVGLTLEASLHIIVRMVKEAQTLAGELRSVLPPDFDFNVYPRTLAMLPPNAVVPPPAGAMAAGA